MARRIEVDEEVYSFLQAHARPFEDTPNSVLRRLLLGRESSSGTGSHQIAVDLPKDLPASLAQILQVIQLVLVKNLSRTEATREVAQRLGVAPQTVLDKYTRQLGMKARDFDSMLLGSLNEIEQFLKTRFRRHSAAIASFFRQLQNIDLPQ